MVEKKKSLIFHLGSAPNLSANVEQTSHSSGHQFPHILGKEAESNP